jgi:hypothetical protein
MLLLGQAGPGTPEESSTWFSATCPAPASGCCDGAGGSGRGDYLLGGSGSKMGVGYARALPAQRRRCGRSYEFEIPIVIEASERTLAVALEYEIPEGWIVSSISDDGQWDERHRKVKWGPYFDNLSRTVTITARPSADQVPREGFSGMVSFDGVNRSIAAP